MNENEKKNKKTFEENIYLIKRFYPYLRKHLKTEVLVLCCVVVAAICEIMLPLIVRQITDKSVENPQELTVNIILLVCAAYIVIRIIDSLAAYFQSYIGHKMGTKIENAMREDMFDHIQTLSFNYFDNTKIGQIMSRMTSDLFDVAEWAHHFPERILMTFVKFIASFFIFASMDFRFVFLIFILMPLMILLTKKSRQRMRDMFRKGRHQIGEINARIEDSLLGVRVVRSFTAEKTEKEKFAKGNAEYVTIRNKSHKYMSQFHATVRILDGIMYMSFVGLGAIMMTKGVTTPGDFTASLLLVSTLLQSVRSIVDFSEQFSRGITGIERFVEIMDEKAEIVDSENAKTIENVKGDIEFRDVSFNYKGSEKKVLDGININIKAGQSVALVGPSGGGKTTLCNLIPRFYDIEKGEILVDGENIKNITLHSLRKNIGVVAQDVYLFSGTVRDNLIYGKPDATDEEIIAAAENAGAHEFISVLPDGYDTYIGERGVKLSGGQKQRISIARVFLKDPPILLLDEATSALDNESEKLVQESLDRLAKGRTTLTIAHRLTTIKGADEILVLTEDGIVEKGSHAELMSQDGIYSKMYNLYSVF
jgi:ATP-binding cassette subfamily B protein